MFDEEGMQHAARKRKGGDEEQNGKKAKMEYMGSFHSFLVVYASNVI